MWIRKWELLEFGKATKVETRRSVAGRPHDRRLRQEAKKALSYPPVEFTGKQALSVGVGFKVAVEESQYAIYACSILPHHVHMVVARHPQHNAERIAGHLKARATHQLILDGLHPLASFRQRDGTIPSPWARKSWPVFLTTDEDIRLAIQYVENNPIKEHKPRQRWSFVVPFTA